MSIQIPTIQIFIIVLKGSDLLKLSLNIKNVPRYLINKNTVVKLSLKKKWLKDTIYYYQNSHIIVSLKNYFSYISTSDLNLKKQKMCQKAS